MKQTIDAFGTVIRAIAGAAACRPGVIGTEDACRQSSTDKWLFIILVDGEMYGLMRDCDSDLPVVSGPLTGPAFNQPSTNR